MPDEWIDHLLDHVDQVARANGSTASEAIDALLDRIIDKELENMEAEHQAPEEEKP